MSGYIGATPVPQSIQRRQTFTATAGQTTFGTTGYTDGDYIDVYLNGVKLVGGTDYTATNGTDIVLTSAASASDVLDFVTFNSFTLVDETIQFADGTAAAPSITNVGDTNTGIYFPGADKIGFVEGGSEVARIAGNDFLINKTVNDTNLEGQEFRNDGQVAFTRDGNHPLIVRRNTNDGDIILIQKDSTTVGSIGNSGTALVFENPNANSYFAFHANNQSNGIFYQDGTSKVFGPYVARDDEIDLGASNARFKDLYLSGGAYLGGTVAANKLDDYETGTWSPVLNGSSSGTKSGVGSYVKIGKTVLLSVTFDNIGTGLSGDLSITGSPFTFDPQGSLNMYVPINWFSLNWDTGALASYGYIANGTSTIVPYYSKDNASSTIVQGSHCAANTFLRFVQTFEIS
jgi:hypothetical protein